MISMLQNLKSIQIKEFLISSDARRQRDQEKNINWGIKDRLPKVE